MTTQGAETRQGQDLQGLGAKHDGPFGAADAPQPTDNAETIMTDVQQAVPVATDPTLCMCENARRRGVAMLCLQCTGPVGETAARLTEPARKADRLGEGVDREAIARTLYLRRHPSGYSCNDSYQWSLAKSGGYPDVQKCYEDADAILALTPDLTQTREAELLGWFTSQHNLSLIHYSPTYGDDDLRVEWRVSKESGPINDREWETVGRGVTVTEAIAEARAALTPRGVA
jgi:hypothetical protein